MKARKIFVAAFLLFLATYVIASSVDAPYWERFQFHYIPEVAGLFLFGAFLGLMSKRIRYPLIGIGVAAFFMGVFFFYKGLQNWLGSEVMFTFTILASFFAVGFAFGWFRL